AKVGKVQSARSDEAAAGLNSEEREDRIEIPGVEVRGLVQSEVSTSPEPLGPRVWPELQVWSLPRRGRCSGVSGGVYGPLSPGLVPIVPCSFEEKLHVGLDGYCRGWYELHEVVIGGRYSFPCVEFVSILPWYGWLILAQWIRRDAIRGAMDAHVLCCIELRDRLVMPR
ncbi:11955_t:CDS:2, partial [Funneliformis geosporum]